MARERILVALSGGVDSSVAALLLRDAGHDVVCAYMKNWINEDNVAGNCPWMQDIADARAVAERLGVEFRVVNLMRDYRRLVVDYLLDGYARGLTPNPDVMCNSRVKFGVFAAYARAEGFRALATGHYAQRVEAEAAGASLDDARADATVGRASSPTVGDKPRPTVHAYRSGLSGVRSMEGLRAPSTSATSTPVLGAMLRPSMAWPQAAVRFCWERKRPM